MADLVINIIAKDNATSAFNRFKDVMHGFNETVRAGQTIYAAVDQALTATVGKTVKYAEQVRDLARAMGAGAEDASVLIQAGDDLGIEFTTLTQATKKLNDEGIQPSIENLGALADEYLSILDPVQRAQFAADKFGLRAGPEMQKLLEKGSDGLQELAKSAEEAGLVMSDETARAARELEIGLDNLSDTGQGLALTVGTELLPVIIELVEIGERAAPVVGKLADGFVDAWVAADQLFDIGQLLLLQLAAFVTGADEAAVANAAMLLVNEGQTDAQLRAAEALSRSTELIISNTEALDDNGDELIERNKELLLAAGLSGDVSKAFEGYNDVLATTGPEIERLNAEIAKYTRMQGMSVTVTGEATTSSAEYELAAIKAANAVKKWQEYSGENREEQLQLQVAAEEAQSRVVKLGESMGTSETYTLNFTTKLGELNAELDENVAKNMAASLAMQESIRQFVYQQLAVEGDAAANLILARNLGLIDEASYQAATAAQILKTGYEDGKFSAEQFGVSAGALATAIAALEGKTITVTTIFEEIHRQTIQDATQAAGGQGGGVSDGTYDPKPNRQFGGPVMLGEGYTVNERGRESFWPEQNGFVMDNADTLDLIGALRELGAAFRGGMGQMGGGNVWGALDEVGRAAYNRHRMGN